MNEIEQRLDRAGAAWRAEQAAGAPAPLPVRPSRERRSWWLPAAAAVAVVALALTAVLVGERVRDSTPAPVAAPGGTWESMPPSPLSARLGATMASWGDAVVVLGGRVERPCPPNAGCVSDPRQSLRDGALYDVLSRTWTRLPDAPLPLDVVSSAVLGDVLYLWVGHDEPSFLALDLQRRTWEQLPTPEGLVGCCLRLVAAGDRVVGYYGERGRADAVDLGWLPEDRRWEPLPPAPFGATYDRTMVWTDQGLVLVTPGSPPSADRTEPPFLRAAVLDGAGWRELPRQEVVVGGSLEWSWTGERVVSASTSESDGGEVGGWGRTLPSGGYLDPATGTWSELPEWRGTTRLPRGPRVAGGRWVANGEGLVLDAQEQRWIELPQQPDAADQDAAAAWAAGRLVVWGGAAGVRPAPDADEARLLDTGAVWTPPQG